MTGLIQQASNPNVIDGNHICRILVRFNASNGSISHQRGCSSVTDNGVGDFSVNFSKAMEDADFIASAHVSYNTNNYNDDHVINTKERWNNRDKKQARFTISLNTNGGSYTDHADMERLDVAIFR